MRRPIEWGWIAFVAVFLLGGVGVLFVIVTTVDRLR